MSKKGIATKKKKQLLKEKPLPPDSTAALSGLLIALVSMMVVVAAILLKPLLEGDGFFAPVQNEQVVVLPDPADDVSTWPRPDPKVGFLVSRACLGVYRQLPIYCNPNLLVSQRHFRAKERIEPGEILFEIPRSLQLWDLDALRDPWIRLHLFEASHRQSGNRMGTEAFLAAYLVLQLKRKQDSTGNWDMELLELAYYDMLPSYEYWIEHHPVFADEDKMKSILGYSEAYGILQAYRNMIISEYEAFSHFSKKFNEMVTREEFFAARMNVLTRAIRVGPPGPEHAIDIPFLKDHYSPEQILQDELEYYKNLLGIDLMKDGCIALIPIADIFNHHPQNNVEYEFTKTELNSKGAFVVRADNRRIEKGFEPMASYGRGIADAHLFSRYGFVNGDGSGPAQITLAFNHDVLRLNISSQYDYFPSTGMTKRIFEFTEEPVAKYLRFDDGYCECIPGPSTHPEEADLKLLKHKHLLRVGNIPNRWQFSVPARNPYSYPSTTHDTPILIAPPRPISFHTKQNLDLELPLTTCRLISLINTDLDGNAAQVLKENLNNPNFLLTTGNDALEYRAWRCLGRWIGAGLIPLEDRINLQAQYDLLRQMNGVSWGTRDWAAQHLRLGEMQSLKAVATTINDIVVERWGNSVPDTFEYKFRDEPCPEEYESFLYDEMEKAKYMIEL